MNFTAQPARSHAVFACAALLLSLLANASAADRKTASVPVIWPASSNLQSIDSAVRVRVLEGDETWGASTPRFQDLDIGDATRTITLAPVGTEGVPAGTTLAVRAQTRGGNRIMFRQTGGELLAFWGSDTSQPTRWVVLSASDTGWTARVSTGRFISHDDRSFAWLGAKPTSRVDDENHFFVMADSFRTAGFAIRFETDAPLFFLTCRANAPHFRVLADGIVVADVNIPGRDGTTLTVPINLGDSHRRRVEILADELEFRGIDLPDVRNGVFAWSGAVPSVRMLWIGDNRADNGARSYPWAASRLLGYEVWSRQWGDHAQRVIGDDKMVPPSTAIREDITDLSPDVIVLAGDFFDNSLEPAQFTKQVNAWLDAVKAAARPEAVKIVLSPLQIGPPVDRAMERRIGIVGKAAKQRGFQFVDMKDWIVGTPEDPSFGNAAQFVSANIALLNPSGHAFVATRFIDQFKRLGVEQRAQLASVKRLQPQRNQNLASTDTAP